MVTFLFAFFLLTLLQIFIPMHGILDSDKCCCGSGPQLTGFETKQLG